MVVDFMKGRVRKASGEECLALWARTPFGLMFVNENREVTVGLLPDVDILDEDLITSCELPGLDQENVQFMVGLILTGRYLEKPGIRHKGDAVLFVLVNEALRSLEEIAKEEERNQGTIAESHASP